MSPTDCAQIGKRVEVTSRTKSKDGPRKMVSEKRALGLEPITIVTTKRAEFRIAR